MEKPISSAPASGMRDLIPNEVALRDWAIGIITESYQQFGFTRIETPIMENINLLRGGEGGENLQLIFEVLKRGDKLERELKETPVRKDSLADLGLRFDLTVPLVRFYANNVSTLPTPLKAIQIGHVFRAESPQVGRYRQFMQCDIDIIGVKTEIAEMELVQATSSTLLRLGFDNFTVRINDRRLLAFLAESFGFAKEKTDRVFITLDKLDKIGLDGVRKELENDEHAADAANKMIDFLTQSQNAKGDLIAQRATLPDLVTDEIWQPLHDVVTAIQKIADGQFKIEFDPTLVRGMGYYTGMIFEISCEGYSSSVAGGGRYDKMVGKFSGRDVPACGFSIGFERIISILSEKGFKPPSYKERIALIFDTDRDSSVDVLHAANELRKKGYIVGVYARKKDMKKHLDQLVTQDYSGYVPYRGKDAELEVKNLK
jgi:histidyl-tRNA synthetase